MEIGRLTSISHCHSDSCRIYSAKKEDFLQLREYQVLGLTQLFVKDLWSAHLLIQGPLPHGIRHMEGIRHDYLHNPLESRSAGENSSCSYCFYCRSSSILGKRRMAYLQPSVCSQPPGGSLDERRCPAFYHFHKRLSW